MALSTLNPPLPALEDLVMIPRPSSPPPLTPPKPKIRRLTRDQRRDILLIRDLGLTYEKIAEQLSQRYQTQITLRSVQYTCNTQKGTPKKAPGRAPTLSKDEIKNLKAFVRSSRERRRMIFQQLGERFSVGKDYIKLTLRKLGYSRRVALRKPPISEKNRVLRLAWAREHIHWSKE
jgi:hypothetical protein